MWIGASDYMEGSPLDRIIFLLLIIIGLIILARRQIDWKFIFSNNVALVVLIAFQAVSIVWSDYPFIGFKRWIKAFGDFVMVLIILTEDDPEDGIKTIIRRLAYVHIPLSIVMIKYFPHLSRSFDAWTGMGSYKGVATSKNILGNICLVCGYYFIWSIITQFKNGIFKTNKINILIQVSIFLMTLWTLRLADSATSLGALVASSILLIILGTGPLKRITPYFGTFIIISVFLFTFLQLTFNIVEVVITMLGRDMTFTTRTDLWAVVLSIKINPIIGAGYESFWLGERLKTIWSIFWYRPNQAHNGYLEVYLNLGFIGLSLLILFIINTFKHAKSELINNFDFGRFRMTYLVILLLYNVTEAQFKGLSLIWFIFILLAIEVPKINWTNFDFEEQSQVPDTIPS
jgi:O-antigen ligase